jgi:hypothetical protein
MSLALAKSASSTSHREVSAVSPFRGSCLVRRDSHTCEEESAAMNPQAALQERYLAADFAANAIHYLTQ